MHAFHTVITLLHYFLIPKSRYLVSHNPGISGLKNSLEYPGIAISSNNECVSPVCKLSHIPVCFVRILLACNYIAYFIWTLGHRNYSFSLMVIC